MYTLSGQVESKLERVVTTQTRVCRYSSVDLCTVNGDTDTIDLWCSVLVSILYELQGANYGFCLANKLSFLLLGDKNISSNYK